MPLMSGGLTFAFFKTAFVALHVADHQSSGFCSDQPGLGELIACSAMAVARTFPRSSQMSVLVPLVPMSMPSRYAMIRGIGTPTRQGAKNHRIRRADFSRP